MKLPPFGKYLFNLIKNQQYPTNDVYIFIGDKAWDKAKAFQVSRPTTMCLPKDDDPERYNWPVLNCDVLLFDTSYSDNSCVENIAFCLLKSGANLIRYVSHDYNLIIYKKDF